MISKRLCRFACAKETCTNWLEKEFRSRLAPSAGYFRQTVCLGRRRFYVHAWVWTTGRWLWKGFFGVVSVRSACCADHMTSATRASDDDDLTEQKKKLKISTKSIQTGFSPYSGQHVLAGVVDGRVRGHARRLVDEHNAWRFVHNLHKNRQAAVERAGRRASGRNQHHQRSKYRAAEK